MNVKVCIFFRSEKKSKALFINSRTSNAVHTQQMKSHSVCVCVRIFSNDLMNCIFNLSHFYFPFHFFFFQFVDFLVFCFVHTSIIMKRIFKSDLQLFGLFHVRLLIIKSVVEGGGIQNTDELICGSCYNASSLKYNARLALVFLSFTCSTFYE